MDDREGVDMDERTGGHWLDTGDGPQRLAVAAGHLAENQERAAWQAYLDHALDCEDCPKSTFQCDVAKELYEAYRAHRPH